MSCKNGNGECMNCTCDVTRRMTPQEIQTGERAQIDAMIWMLNRGAEIIRTRMSSAQEAGAGAEYLAGMHDAACVIDGMVKEGQAITNREIMLRLSKLKEEQELSVTHPALLACGKIN